MISDIVVKDINLNIRNNLGIDFDEQKLLYMRQTINDDGKIFSQYRIIDGYEIKLIISFKKESFKICIEMQSGVLSKDTLTDVKRKIQGHCQLTPEEQILVYQGSVLEGDSDITSFGVQDKSVVHVLHRLVNGLRILVQTLGGKMVTFNISKFDRVIDIKKKIQEKMGLSPDEQRLVFKGGILDDEKTVDEYQITEKSVINVVSRLRGGMRIFAKTMDGKKIQEKIGLLPEEQKLMYQGEVLQDQKTVRECQITEKSVIHVDVILRSGIQISVRTMNGEMVSFDVTKSDRVIDIKKKIQEKIKLVLEGQRLVFDGVILEDGKTVDEYNITENCVINIVTRLVGTIQIFVKILGGKIVSFEVTKSDRIIDIKKKIQEKIGLFPDQQILMYQGGILEDEKTVDEYQITEKSVINVVARLRIGMQIFAKTLDGKMVSFEVTKSDRIIDIKKKIQEKIGLSPDEQKLVYKGGMLEDKKTVEEYQIADKSVIIVVARLRGAIQISVRTMDGKIMSFEVTRSERVIDIKKMIQEKIKLALEGQSLVFNGVILEDEKTVDECQMAEKSVIDVVTRSRRPMEIFVKTILREICVLNVTSTDTIIDIKKKIQEKMGLSVEEQRLVYQGGILKDEKTVDEYQIAEKSVIYVLAILRRPMEIFVKTILRETYVLNVTNLDKIIDLKKKIQENTQLSIVKQTLVYQGVLLDNEKTVEYYEIDDGSVILVMVSPRRLMEIFVSLVGGERYRLNVTSTDTIMDVKKNIRDVTGTDSSERPLAYQGYLLDDNKTLDYYDIEEGAVILSLSDCTLKYN